MKQPRLRIVLTSLLGLAAMGMNGCPNTMSGVTGNNNTNTGANTNTNANMNTSGGGMSVEELQLAMDALTAINNHRAGKSLPAYTWYAAGADVGYAHCLAMEAGSFFEHVDPNTGKDPATRALDAGIMHDPDGTIDPTSGNPFVGENLYMAVNAGLTGQDAVDAWVTSPGHHTQIDAPMPVSGAQTMPAWTHCGIGVRRNGGNVWYTAMFFKNPN
ncbi:MAG: CAP domain-containing protein [Phycisphaerales bacterium]|nr:CAP domain-containing protein [Phycisphaerales bacterium]